MEPLSPQIEHLQKLLAAAEQRTDEPHGHEEDWHPNDESDDNFKVTSGLL
jgi:hypothetical protein